MEPATETETDMKTNTVQMVRNGSAQLDSPTYVSKPYVVTGSKGNVLMAGTLAEVAALPLYYNDEAVDIRRHDLHDNDNTRAQASKPDRIKVIKPNGFEICADANQFANCIAGEYGTKAERESLRRLFPSFLRLELKPIVWGDIKPDISESEHAALVAVAEAAKYLLPALETAPDIALKDGCICAGCGSWTPKGHPEAHDHEDNCPEVRKRSAIAAQLSHAERHGRRILGQALANLAAVREGKVVQS